MTQVKCGQKTWKDTSAKIYKWQIRTWKNIQHHMSLEDSKSKQQWDTTTHILECPKSQTQKTPNTGKDKKPQELSFIAGGNKKWYSHFGRESGNFLES